MSMRAQLHDTVAQTDIDGAWSNLLRARSAVVPSGTSDTVSEFLDNQLSPETKRAYRSDLKKWFDFLGGRIPDQRIALDFRSYLEGTVSSRSAARTQNTVRTFYKFVAGPNPWERIRSTRRVRNATPDVPSTTLVDNMLARCDNLRDKAIIALLLNGLRAAEVADLRSVDWQWSEEYDNHIIRVIGKGAKQRLVPANSETERIVQAYVSQFETLSTFLIRPKRKGERLTTRRIEYIIKKWGGRDMHPHALRHHYATRLIRSGASVFAVQALLGHESVATTQVYVTLNLTDILAEARKDPRNNG